jgi:hypothetical protein
MSSDFSSDMGNWVAHYYDDLAAIFCEVHGVDAARDEARESAFVREAVMLFASVLFSITIHEFETDRIKAPCKWEADRQRLLKLIDGLDPRMVARIHARQAELVGQSTGTQGDVVGLLHTLLEKPFTEEFEWKWEGRGMPKRVVAQQVLEFCEQWNIDIDTASNSPFEALMELLKDYTETAWHTYKFAKFVRAIQEEGPRPEFYQFARPA